MSTIAWIGLGHMGAPMAAHLVAAGHIVRGFDVNAAAVRAAAEHGIHGAHTLAEAVRDADVVITSLPRPEHVRDVYGGVNGIFVHAIPGTLLLDTSTVDIETSRWCHDQAEEQGFAFVDAPISGGTAGAAAHTLTFMLGGHPDDVTRAKEAVTPMAGKVIDCGGPGMGIAAKLVNNMMLFINMMGVAEASQLAQALGLNHRVLYDVAAVSSGSSWALKTWYPVPGVVETAAANRGFEATFSVDLARKDAALAVTAGERAQVPLAAAALALSQLDDLVDAGLGGFDCSLVVQAAAPGGTVAGFTGSGQTGPDAPGVD